MINRIFFATIGICFMVMVLLKVKKKRFFEKESFLWLIGSLIGVFLAIFPKTIDYISSLVGIYYGPSLLFLVAIIFILYLLFRQTEQVSLLKEQVKHLGQKVVVLEKLLEEEKNSGGENG